jgi:beta-phosphoglucomutase-like phosphatase (HAD superfamily)
VSARSQAPQPPFPGPPFGGVIFDMDGVLTDSEPAFYAAINDVLALYGTSVGMREYARFIGSATPATWSGLIEMKQLPASLEGSSRRMSRL